MTIVLKNNVVGYLAVAASAGDTVLRLRLNDGLKFPFLEPLQYFYATLTSATQGDAMEIVKVTYRMNDNLSVVRAQEDTTAIAFPVGAKVELRVTAKSIKDAIGEVDVTSNVEAAQAAAQAAAGSAASASTSATAAGSSAQAALTSETNAASSFQAASASAGQASTFANQASQSASNAAGSASAASISSGTAANSASSAAGSADSALGSANAASISAGNASTSATQSSQSASDAAGSASAAQISATTAASSAFNAAGSASGALGSANAASASASSASTSASQSSQSASNAAGSASAANISAIAAAASEFAAAGSASGASSSASAASTSASQAATSASAAGASATASQGFATTAQGYRDDALIYRNDALGYRDAASSFADAANNSSVLADGYRAAAASSATLSANYAKQGGVAYTVSDFVADGLFWTTAFGGSPTTVADPPAAYTYTDVAAVGRVARVSLSAGDSYLQPKAVFQPVVGRKYRARVSAKVFSNATGGGTLTGAFYINGMNASFVHTDPSSDWTSAPDGSRVSIKSPFVEADGVVNFGIIYTCTAVSSNSAYWRIRFGMVRSGGAGGVIEVREFLIEEITDIATTNATITTLQQTVSDGDQANATSITNLSASFGTGLAFGANACPDSNFDNIDAVWTNLYTQSGSLASKSVVTSAGKRFLRRQNTGMTVGHQANLGVGYTYATPCSVGQRLELSAYVSFTNCSSANLVADWYDASGNYITSSTVVNGMTNNARSGGFVTAPVLAERVALNVIAYAAAATNEYQITEPYLRKVSSSQTALSPYERSVDPGTFAAITTEANARAAADSALTTTTTTLTAQVRGAASGGPSINTSPNFADNANATGIPTNWADWSWGWADATRVTGIAPQPYAWRIVATAGRDTGILQNLLGRVTAGWHVIEADITLNSGVLSSAGVHVNWDGGSTNIVFSTDPDINGAVIGAGTAGKLYKFRKLVQVTAGTTYQSIYAMSIWNGYGSLSNANDITWHRVALRAASQAEIEARQAKEDLVTANAAISANQTAIANEAGARASADNTLTASFTSLSSKTTANPNLLRNGTFARGWEGWPTHASPWNYINNFGGLGHYAYANLNDGGTANDKYLISESISAYANVAYTLSARAYRNNIASGRWWLRMDFRDSSNAYISSSALIDLYNSSGTSAIANNVNTDVSVTATTPAGTAYIQVASNLTNTLTGGSGFAEVQLARIKVEGGSTATTWNEEGTLSNTVGRLVTTEANVSANQSAIATESAARASADSTLTARVAGSDLAINSNPTFTTYTNTTGVPDDWSTWEGGETGYRVAGIAPKVYAYRIVGTANINRGIQQYVGGRVTQGWHVLEYDVTLNSGTFSGAGGHLNWGVDGLQGSVNISFASDLDTTGAAPGNGVVGRLYKFRKLINVTTAGVNTSFIYAMAHWTGLGNIASANDITFHRVAIRPASQAEIEGRTALDLINTPGTGLQAQITNNATAIANETSARAAADTVLTARVDGADANGSLLKNPFFRIPFTSGTIPSGWYVWAATPPTIQHVAAPYGMAGNILYMTANAGANCGIAQTILGGISPGSKYKVGAQVARASGTLATAGIYIAWFTDAGVYISATNIPFVNTPRTDGTTGADPDRVVRYEKELTAPANAYRAEMILMNGWDGFGSVQAAGIYWFEAMFAPSTIAEAAIRTEAEARATADSANTSLITTLTARVNVNSNRFPHPQPLSTTLPSGWGGGIGVGNWEPLGGLFYYKARASGAAVTEWYYYDLEDSATAYIDTNQQYTLSATGYGGAGVPGDRTMMRIELFNSSGTLIHGSPYVLLTGYGPRASTTTSLTSGGEYVRRRVVFQREWAASGSYQDVVFNYIKLERGSAATAYTTEGSSNSLQAGVTTNASAIATVDGKLTASYGVTVDANGRIAQMKLLSNGTTSSVKFTADSFQVFNGSTDEAPFVVEGGVVKAKKVQAATLSAISADLGTITSGSVTLTAGSYVVRLGAGFGQNSDLILWYGLASTADGSRTKTNGKFALATDGKVYFGTSDFDTLTTPMTATMTGDYSTTHSTNVTPTIDVSPAVSNITNGTSPYTYQWALVNMEEGSAPTITSATSAQCNIYNGATLSAALNYVGTVSCTITDANGKQLVKFFNFADYSTL